MRFGSAAAASLLWLVRGVLACECEYQPPCSRIHTTDAIFIGSVKDAGREGRGPFLFEVEEAFKGIVERSREVTVLPDLCIAQYRPGLKYLALAKRSAGGSLSCGDCTGTVPVEYAENDIRIIRASATGMPVQELQGRIAENTEDSMVRFEFEVEKHAGLAGVQVTAGRGRKFFTGKSDSRGIFRIQVPEPGEYRVKAAYPGYSSTESEYEFNVQPGGCSEHDIGMWTDSKVSGIVFDAARHPVSGMTVEMMLYSRTTSFSPMTVITDANGSFIFSRVPKGDYLLGVTLNGFSSKLPYETRYYPGVTRREFAIPVRVGGPEVLNNLNLQIGTRLPTRQIKAFVIWPDGTPVINANVGCVSSRSDDRRFRVDRISRYTDSQGQAVCDVLSDRDYQVEAERLDWSASSRPILPIATRPRIFVAAGTAPVSVQITIDRINDICDKESPSDMSPFNERQQ
jgi:hypothetical protein